MIDKKSGNESIIKTGVTDRKNLAFIFSDVRGFTSFTEKNDPEIVIEILNMYFELQAKIIKARKGDIDDYVGDQIMAHFGGENRIENAIVVSIEIMNKIKKINDERKRESLPYFDIGIGLNCGEVVVGNIGASGFRMDFACLGDAVNLTSRLCAAAEPLEILITKETYKKSKKKFKFKNHKPIIAKGKSKMIEVHSISY
jgi:adenylate cyclase